jgi:hypothetical protein
MLALVNRHTSQPTLPAHCTHSLFVSHVHHKTSSSKRLNDDFCQDYQNRHSGLKIPVFALLQQPFKQYAKVANVQ